MRNEFSGPVFSPRRSRHVTVSSIKIIERGEKLSAMPTEIDDSVISDTDENCEISDTD